MYLCMYVCMYWFFYCQIDEEDDDDDDAGEEASLDGQEEVRVIAGRSLGDLVMKLGDKVRSHILLCCMCMYVCMYVGRCVMIFLKKYFRFCPPLFHISGTGWIVRYNRFCQIHTYIHTYITVHTCTNNALFNAFT